MLTHSSLRWERSAAAQAREPPAPTLSTGMERNPDETEFGRGYTSLGVHA